MYIGVTIVLLLLLVNLCATEHIFINSSTIGFCLLNLGEMGEETEKTVKAFLNYRVICIVNFVTTADLVTFKTYSFCHMTMNAVAWTSQSPRKRNKKTSLVATKRRGWLEFEISALEWTVTSLSMTISFSRLWKILLSSLSVWTISCFLTKPFTA